jgi:nucleoside-diphosphate-sugar epimerase
MSTEQTQTVLVTGATGYLASWAIKQLLEQGQTVHATVRDVNARSKHQHLLDIAENASGTLSLFSADLLTEGSFAEAMVGCDTVIHMASPFVISGITDPQQQLIKPAEEGTRNVLAQVDKTETVKRVVLTSSVAAIYGDAIDLLDTQQGIFTEAHWNTTSRVDHQPYSLSKTLAERLAWKMSEAQSRWDLVVINPGFIMGPSLTNRKDSTSIGFMRGLLKGQYKSGAPDLAFGLVDVRDVANAHIQAAFRSEASGRHILVASSPSVSDMASALREEFGRKYALPKSSLPKWLVWLVAPLVGLTRKFVKNNLGYPLAFDNSYSQKDLGIEYRSMRETLADHANQLEKDGLL